MIHCLIVDDEPIARNILEKYIIKTPGLQLVGQLDNALEVVEFLKNHKVDLIFLDINMPKLTGFEFLKTLNNPPKVIVTTAYQEFALEGYELNISDYLLKPFSFERFVKAINKAIGTIEKQKTDQNSNSESLRFFIKGDKKYHQIKSSEIRFVEAYGNYTKLFMEDEMILSHENISYYEKLLPEAQFLRIHKSYIIALDKIKQIEGNRILIDTHKIPIGRTYKSVVTRLFER